MGRKKDGDVTLNRSKHGELGEEARHHLNAVIDWANTAQTQINALQPAIEAQAAISDLSEDVTVTLLTQVKALLDTTNAKVNDILAALRATGIINA